MSIYITSARTEDLDAATREAIIEVCVAAHQEEEFRRLFWYVPAGGWHFLGYEGEELVSHAMVTTRWLQNAGESLLKTAYVDAVASLPERQGRGYGSAVMRSLAEAVDGEYEIACLQTDRPTFYARLGWKLWQGPLAGRRGEILEPTPDQAGVMVLPLSRTPALDEDGPLTIECQKTRIW